MNTPLFLISLLIALAGPILAITYLRPILYKVLRLMCDADGGAEFWVRCAYILAVSGTLLLMLAFGEFGEHSSLADTLRRSLALVLAGVFASVALIARNVWSQVRHWMGTRPAASAAPSGTPLGRP